MTVNESAIDMTVALEQAFPATMIEIAEIEKATGRSRTLVVRTLGRRAVSWIMEKVDQAVCGDEEIVKESPETPRSAQTKSRLVGNLANRFYRGFAER
jgi:hypothetical protein